MSASTDQRRPERSGAPSRHRLDVDAARDPDAADDPVGDVEARIRAHVDALAGLLDGTHQPATTDAARGRLRHLRRLTGLAHAGTAEAVGVLQRHGAIRADGASSTAAWVKANTGRSGRDAARVARLATDLADLPTTRDLLASGAITDESADALVGAARDGRLGPPSEVDTVLAEVAASSSPEALRADIRDRQQAADATAMLGDENRQHAVRDVRLTRRDTGVWCLSGDLPDELGQRVRTAFDAFDHPDPDGTPDDQRRRPGQRLADALAAMTDTVLDRGLAPTTGGISRPHLSVIVHADTASTDLTRPGADDPSDPIAAPAPDDPRWADLPAGELPWGGKLSPQAVRRICCDAAVSRIVMAGESQVLDVGRATRTWSGPQRRAVNARDRGCRGPTCTRPIAWTQVHHLQWWRHDGATSVDNGLALCHHCHRLVHDHGWTVSLDLETAAATWTGPDGRQLVTHPQRRTTGPHDQSDRVRSPGSASRSSANPPPGNVDVACINSDLDTADDPRTRGPVPRDAAPVSTGPATCRGDPDDATTAPRRTLHRDSNRSVGGIARP